MRLLFLLLLCSNFVLQTVVAQQMPYKGGSGKFQNLVWSDEFSGDGLPDPSRWDYEKGHVRNHELQYYTNARIENTEIKNGFLQLTARNDSLQNGAEVYPVTSASVTTKDKEAWTYGRIEIRAKFPSSRGTWPAIWMLGADIDSTNWPACGEIDIMEHVGFMPDTVHVNVHAGTYTERIDGGRKILYKEAYNDFHVYAIEWFPDRIDWYLDAQKIFTYNKDDSNAAAWPFNKPQYLILNLAFGGDWGAQCGVDISLLPQTFFIDYVRVYQ